MYMREHMRTHTHTQLLRSFILLSPGSHPPPPTPWELPTCLALLQLSRLFALLLTSSLHIFSPLLTPGCSVANPSTVYVA